jgi:hypothetical protein
MGPLILKAEDSTWMPIPISFTGDFKFTIVLSTILYAIEPEAREGKKVFKFFIILSPTKEGFGFTINLYINFSIKPEAKRDFRLGLLNATIVRFSRNSIKGDFRYIALYIEFPAGELGGHSKEIFKFRMEFYTTNIPF